MEHNARFTVTTFMDKEDYRKFLYFTTFHNVPRVILSLGLLSGLVSALLLFLLGIYQPIVFFSIWLFMLLSCIAALCYKIEKITKKQAKENAKKLFEYPSILTFYENELAASHRDTEGSSHFKYEDILSITETTEYLIFFFSDNSANLLRKKDMEKDELPILRDFLKEKIQKKYRLL